MKPRVIRRIRTVHQLVAVSDGKVTTRCGLVWRKPRAGYGAADCFSHTCTSCDEATEELATLVAPK